MRSLRGGPAAEPRAVVARARMFGDPEHEVFFGYYDICPFSSDGRKLLAHRLRARPEPSSSEQPIAVGSYDLDGEQAGFRQIDQSATWCWQQGTRLQWYPRTGPNAVLYNALVGGGYGCRIKDIIDGTTLGEIDRPIYAASSDGRWGLSLNFSRLQRLRPGYGYGLLPDATETDPCPQDDGVWLVDMEAARSELIVSTRQVAAIEPHPTMQGAVHYLNHLLFRPDGERFLVFHLWLGNGRRHRRLMTFERDGNDPCVLVPDVSHYNWLSNESVIATAGLDGSMSYSVFEDRSNRVRPMDSKMLNADGHPSLSPDGEKLLTDTYQDHYGERSVLIGRADGTEILEVARMDNPARLFGEYRCDLHPRWDCEGQQVCFDSAHSGRRAMYVIDASINASSVS